VSTKLPREGEIRVWRIPKPPLPDASDVPAHEGSRDVAVPWEPAPSSSVVQGEEADPPPPKEGRKGRTKAILVDNQLEKKMVEKRFVGESFSTSFFDENKEASCGGSENSCAC
jgi:hypothetical protein